MSNLKNSRLVYSTETGSVCPKCGQPVRQCNCKKGKAASSKSTTPFPADGTIRIRREKQGRKGKTVTAIYGLSLPEDELGQLARTLKRRCGTGGTVKEGIVYIQGEHREILQAELQALGHTVKLAGG